MIRHLCITLAFGALVTACRKESLPATHYLGADGFSHTIMIHQSLSIIDSTALNDSLLLESPPTDRIYRWTILPDSTGVHLTGNYIHGELILTFDRSGTYKVSAQIYDSATDHLLAMTKTFTIEVTTDTLYPSTVIDKMDQLTLTCNSYGHATFDTSIQHYYFELDFTTRNNYLINSIIPWQWTLVDGGGIDFSDTTSLTSFPFSFFGSQTSPISTYVAITNLPVGSTQPFSVVWLDQTYTGTITRPSPGSLSFNWDNTGPVKIQRGAMIQ